MIIFACDVLGYAYLKALTLHGISIKMILIFQAKKRELDHIRQNYRKNSLARVSSAAAMKPVMTLAGIPTDDFVDETMEDEIISKEIPQEKEENIKNEGDANINTTRELVSQNQSGFC